MTTLSVNVNKLATLRNSRGKNNPDVVRLAGEIVSFGAHGITVHPRPDERHIRRADVDELKNALHVELNVEGYPSEEFLAMVERVRPAQCTLVPDPPHVLTSNAGWRVRENQALLRSVSARLKRHGIRVSVFVDPRATAADEYAILREAGVDRVELFTERYAEHFDQPDFASVLNEYKSAAAAARATGLDVNAGHDLNLGNLPILVSEIPWLAEVSIGHALICDALSLGLKETIRRYLACLSGSSPLSPVQGDSPQEG